VHSEARSCLGRLGAELTEHLGYPPGQAPPRGAGNDRNGATTKTVHTRARAGAGAHGAIAPAASTAG
jgi:hypothetical protein